MDLKLFVMVNKPYCSVEGIFLAPNFSLAVRDNFQNWLGLYPNLLEDYDVYEIGSISREITNSSLDVHLNSDFSPVDWSHFKDEMEYIPKKMSLHQQEVMRRGLEQQLGSIEKLTERMERLKHLDDVNHPVADVKQMPDGVAPLT